ncbi:hypothetical protein [Polaromonas sp. LjRoot131]|uniref:hypothetical protein n=1 Tax=Polaromonas sp. LjRoot131 TaxID=3342262 RepID=UPI003ECE306D
MPLLKSFVAWLVILALAVANGALREIVLIPALGKTTGLVVSGVLLCLFVMLVSFAFVRLSHGITILQGLCVGASWLCLTLVFEFVFGRYLQHKSWSELLEAYAFKDGNIWPVVLLVILLAPPALVLLQERFQHAGGSA